MTLLTPQTAFEPLTASVLMNEFAVLGASRFGVALDEFLCVPRLWGGRRVTFYKGCWRMK